MTTESNEQRFYTDGSGRLQPVVILGIEYETGRCSCPVWIMGSPAGTCDKPAFSRKLDAWDWPYGRLQYEGEVSRLACVGHGGAPCPGIDLGDGNWSGCTQSDGDCPTCGK